MFSQLSVCIKTVIRKYWRGKKTASARGVAWDSGGPASLGGAPGSARSAAARLPPARVWACSEAPPAPPLGVRVRAGRRRAVPGSPREARCQTRLSSEVRSCGRMEPSKVEKFGTTDRGNGLRALAPLRPGELLFRSDPLAYTVCKGSRGVVCDRCLLGYVRSALAHTRPVSAVRGTVRPGTPPGRGCTAARRCCRGAQPRTPPVRFPGAHRG